MIPARRTALVLLLALAALVVAACGSSGDKKAPSGAQDILKDTFGPDHPVKSGKLDLAVSFTGTGLQGVDGPVKLSLKGPFQSKGGKTLPAFDFDIGLNGAGTSFTAGALSTGEAGYLKFQGTSYALTKTLFDSFKKGYEASAKETEDKDDGPSFSSLGVDPLRWLGNPKTVGEEQVGGADTRHVSATVDVPKLLTDVDTLLKKAGDIGGAAGQSTEAVPTSLTAAQRKQITDAVKATTFDLWAGKDDGTLRKLDIKVGFAIPAADQAKAGGLKNGTLRVTLTIADLNEDQDIVAPKTSRPLTELQAQIGSLLGTGAPTGGAGAGGGAGTPEAPAGTTPAEPAAPAQPQSKYLECLTAAGADIAKVNACAELQGQ